MSQYLAILQQFAQALDTTNDPIQCVSAASISNFGIYRNNIQLNRTNALRIAYPTIQSLVGKDFFAAMSLQYVQLHAATHANLHLADEHFSKFIADFSPAAELPYLSDVARLDWAIHVAHYAPDMAAMSAQSIAEHHEAFATLKFQFHPAMKLIESAHPIASILAMHHGGEIPEDANASECVLVWRDQYAKIAVTELRFIAALQAQQCLADALEGIATFAPQFNPSHALSLLLTHGLITAIYPT